MSAAADTGRVELPDGATLAWRATGRGPALLLVTGLGGTAAFWDPVIPALSARWRVVRFDQRGIAASTRGTAPVTIARLAADAFAVMDAAGVDRAVVVGHSTGGAIAQDMALGRPERIVSLGLTGTWAKADRYMHDLFATRRRLLTTDPVAYVETGLFLGCPADWIIAHPQALEAARRIAPTGEAARIALAERIDALLAFDRLADLPRLTLPALVIGAEDDLIVPLALSRDLAARLPQGRLMVLPTGGHFFPYTRIPLFAGALERLQAVS